MDAGIFHGFQTALSVQNLYFCFIGCLWGTIDFDCCPSRKGKSDADVDGVGRPEDEQEGANLQCIGVCERWRIRVT